MKIGFVWLAVVAALLTGVSSAHAQEMIVEELVALALDKAPQLQAARAEIAVAAGATMQAGLRPNPMLGVDQAVHGMRTSSVEVSWPLDLFRRPGRVAVARTEAEVTTLAVRDEERVLAAAVRAQAGRLLAARRTLEIANEALTLARRMRDLLDRRFSEGGSTRLDANLAGVEVLRLEADLALASGEVEAAGIELKALAGLPADAPLVLRDSLESLAASPPAPPLTPTAALETRPDLREALARIVLADARSESARREAQSDISLVAGFTRNGLEFPQLGLDERGAPAPIQNTFHAVSFGARVSLPFLNRNQGALASARAEREGAEALFAARQRAARADIDAAIARDRQARRAVEIYGGAVRTLARQNVEVMLEAYDLGRFPLADVLSEQRRYLDIEGSYTTVLLRAYEARTAMSRAFGEIR